MLAGGTGFAPIKAVIEHAIQIGYDSADHASTGARDRDRPLHARTGASWESRAAGFSLHSGAVRSADGDAWQGRTGFVHQAVMADLPDLSGHQVYACGGPAMIDAAKARLDRPQRQSADRCVLHADAFTFANDAMKP
jgi:CDP-4-dehydro-6-deoxyglucose reductase